MGDDFIIQFEYSPKNDWRIFKNSLLYYIGSFIGFILYFLYRREIGLFLGCGFLIIILPQIFIHLQYRFLDRNRKIIVNHSKMKIDIFKKGEIEKDFTFDEIREIIRHKGQADENNYFMALPMFIYHYTELALNNGESVFFTDFITPSLGIKKLKRSEKISFLNIINI